MAMAVVVPSFLRRRKKPRALREPISELARSGVAFLSTVKGRGSRNNSPSSGTPERALSKGAAPLYRPLLLFLPQVHEKAAELIPVTGSQTELTETRQEKAPRHWNPNANIGIGHSRLFMVT